MKEETAILTINALEAQIEELKTENKKLKEALEDKKADEDPEDKNMPSGQTAEIEKNPETDTEEKW